MEAVTSANEQPASLPGDLLNNHPRCYLVYLYDRARPAVVGADRDRGRGGGVYERARGSRPARTYGADGWRFGRSVGAERNFNGPGVDLGAVRQEARFQRSRRSDLVVWIGRNGGGSWRNFNPMARQPARRLAVRQAQVPNHLVGGGVHPPALYDAPQTRDGYPGEDAEDEDGDQDLRQGEALLTSTGSSCFSQRTHSLSRTFSTTLQNDTKLQQSSIHPPYGLFPVILSYARWPMDWIDLCVARVSSLASTQFEVSQSETYSTLIREAAPHGCGIVCTPSEIGFSIRLVRLTGLHETNAL